MKAEDKKTAKEQAFDSIKRQWNGGEHRLAGARASELIYADGSKMDEKTLDELREELPGIERYISAPEAGTAVQQVSEQGGDPLASQPENRKEATGASNLSSDKAKKEQKAVDKTLERGRKARAKAASTEGKGGAGEIGSTKLNPDPQNPDAA